METPGAPERHPHLHYYHYPSSKYECRRDTEPKPPQACDPRSAPEHAPKLNKFCIQVQPDEKNLYEFAQLCP